MNPVDKAIFAQELSELIKIFKTPNVSYFQLARAQQRLAELHQNCPQELQQLFIQKKQQKALIDTQNFIQQSSLYPFCCGAFSDQHSLEHLLYQQSQSSWAILCDSATRWQIWLLQQPNHNVFVSDFDGLQQVDAWLNAQNLKHALFGPTSVKIPEEITLQPAFFKAPVESAPLRSNQIKLQTSNHTLQQKDAPILVSGFLRSKGPDISHGLSFDLGLEEIDLEPQDDLVQITENAITPSSLLTQQKIETPKFITPLPTTFSTSHFLTPEKLITELQGFQSILLGHIRCEVEPLFIHQDIQEALYRLHPEVTCSTTHLDLFMNHVPQNNVLNYPIYFAEQVDQQGFFVRYLVLFGAQSDIQATRLAHLLSTEYNYKIMALARTRWENIKAQLFDIETLFQNDHTHTTPIWQHATYLPFIPKHCIDTHKFIQFTEIHAQSHTPLLLLKERQKIRVIHGENRLKLNSKESAYPYLLLDRQHGVSWQLIQRIIKELPQPIDVVTLYQAIQASLK